MIHSIIINELLKFKPVIVDVDSDTFIDCLEECTIDYDKKEIYIQVCKEELIWRDEGVLDFASRSYVDVESLIEGFDIIGNYRDAYGSILTDDDETLLLNNYDACFYEENKSEDGFCNVIGFATITSSGVIRFTQLVYSFLHNKLIVRDDVSYQLTFTPDLNNDFGGKRAVYRYDNILSLRCDPDLYKKVDKNHHQSDEHKNDLSYPRFIINV